MCLRRGLPRGVAPNPTKELFEKSSLESQKLFYGKVLGSEQRAVNTEYSVFARPAWILFAKYFRFARGVAPNPIRF